MTKRETGEARPDLSPGKRGPAAAIRLERHGAPRLSDAELLELVLGPGGGIPPARAAADLMLRFETVRALIGQHPATLRRKGGLGPARSRRLSAALELARRAGAPPERGRRAVRSPSDALPLLREEFRDKDREHFLVLHLDTRHRILGVETISIGCLNASIVHPREVFREAVARGAAAIIVAHNHPSGCAEPSRDDLHLTSRLDRCGRLMGIEVLDHLVVCPRDYTSIREYGWPRDDGALPLTAEG